MRPYEIRIKYYACTEDFEPVYKVYVDMKNGETIISSKPVPMEEALELVKRYCCTE